MLGMTTQIRYLPVSESDPRRASTPAADGGPLRLRWAWWLLAYVSLGLGLIGIVVPGLPTVPFVLLSAFAAARGSMRLHDRLLAHRHGRVDAVGDPPQAVRENLPDLVERPRPAARHGISYLPQLGRCKLVIVGGGHVGQAVGNLAAELDFDVWAIDDRGEYVTEERFPRAERRIAGTIGEVLPGLDITPSTYCLIVTRGHNHDEEALYHLVDRGARYVGMIGSKRKIKLIFDDLVAEGISPEALARVHAPVGLDIGSQTVPEIAVSILAELIAHRNCGGVVPGRPAGVSVESE